MNYEYPGITYLKQGQSGTSWDSPEIILYDKEINTSFKKQISLMAYHPVLRITHPLVDC